jgi:hypothetical protein
VALRYGPLIYSAESIDQDLDKVLSPASALTAEWKGGLLGGVMVIKGVRADGSVLTAIPNYARNNRAAPEGGGGVSSSVWLRDE